MRSKAPGLQPDTGFTLIELLVVITVIVVLLALLAPALDQAVYQAELAVDAAKLDAIASGTDAYALSNQRAYPYRPVLREGTRWLRPHTIVTQQGKDDRPYLRQAYGQGLNKTLLDPLCGKINLDHTFPPVDTNAGYSLWFGMSYPAALGGDGKPMRRLGDSLVWTDNTRQRTARISFSVIASDLDVHYQIPGVWQVIAGHPDSDGKLYFFRSETSSPTPVKADQISQGYVLSWWGNSTATHIRGTVDTHYAFTDGSVQRYNGVKWDDERMARVPWQSNASSWSATSDVAVWHHLPRR